MKHYTKSELGYFAKELFKKTTAQAKKPSRLKLAAAKLLTKYKKAK